MNRAYIRHAPPESTRAEKLGRFWSGCYYVQIGRLSLTLAFDSYHNTEAFLTDNLNNGN